MRELKDMKWESIFTEILVILLGIILLLNPGTTAKTICYIVGMIIMAVGIIKIMAYFVTNLQDNLQKNNFATGAVFVIIGILFVVKVNLIVSIVPFVMGIFVILSGLGKLQTVFNLKRMKSDGWLGLLIVAVINIGLGILLFSDLIGAAKLMIRVIGACMIFSGVTDLINIVYLSKKINNYLKDMQALEQEDDD